MSTDLVRHGNRKAARVVPAKFKIAVGVMLQQPKEDLQTAAAVAGMTTQQLRKYLRPIGEPVILRRAEADRMGRRRCWQSSRVA